MELYAAMLEHLDENVGRLIRYLKANNLYDDTLFVFLSDNGPEGNIMKMGPPWDNSRVEDWGKKGTFIQYGPAWAQVSAGPFRMFKGFQSEGGIRTPMIIAGRGVRGGGRISEAVAHVMDVPATLLKAAGVAYPANYQSQPTAPLQGKSLVPIADASRSDVRGQSDWLGWELFGNRAIRQDKWKLLWLCSPFGPGKWQLYDLNADPGETKDLSDAQPKTRDQLLRRWTEYARVNNVILPSESRLCAKVTE